MRFDSIIAAFRWHSAVEIRGLPVYSSKYEMKDKRERSNER